MSSAPIPANLAYLICENWERSYWNMKVDIFWNLGLILFERERTNKQPNKKQNQKYNNMRCWKFLSPAKKRMSWRRETLKLIQIFITLLNTLGTSLSQLRKIIFEKDKKKKKKGKNKKNNSTKNQNNGKQQPKSQNTTKAGYV